MTTFNTQVTHQAHDNRFVCPRHHLFHAHDRSAVCPPEPASALPRVDSWGVLAPSSTCPCDCAGCNMCLDACVPLPACLMAPPLRTDHSSCEVWNGEVKLAETGPATGMDDAEPLARGGACMHAHVHSGADTCTPQATQRTARTAAMHSTNYLEQRACPLSVPLPPMGGVAQPWSAQSACELHMALKGLAAHQPHYQLPPQRTCGHVRHATGRQLTTLSARFVCAQLINCTMLRRRTGRS